MFIRTCPQIALCLLATVFAALGQSLPPANYYDSAIGPTGAALKSALHGIIDGHTVRRKRGRFLNLAPAGAAKVPIFKDDADRRRFLVTLAEACQRTGWRGAGDLQLGPPAIARG